MQAQRQAQGSIEELRAFAPACRELLCLPGREASRGAFLRAASEVVLRHTLADRLELWIDNGSMRYRWRVVTDGQDDGLLEPLPRPDHSDAEAPILLDQALDAAGLRRNSASVCQRPAGSCLAPTRDASACQRGFFPFSIDEESGGVLQLDSNQPLFFDAALVDYCEGLVHVLGVAFANRLTEIALVERVKELSCMYQIAQVAAEHELSLDDTMQAIVELLPPGWQYPAITRARISLDQLTYTSAEFQEGPYSMSADVVIRGRRCGLVEVFYTERFGDADDTGLLDEAPFLAEERHLIDAVARELASIIERKRADEERARLEQQVRRADRLATIGQLAAGVAHELNEPLGTILGFAQLANKVPELPVQTRSDIDRIVTASLYAREIIKKLMFFSRQTPANKVVLSFDQVVEDALDLLRPRCAREAVELARRGADDLPPILGDHAQLQQVVVNLLVNAIQAMPSGGKLSITTEVRDGAVVLAVEDTGVGMPAGVVERAFVPFFTTKDVGQGTGLGLSVVHGIITAHGGTVTVNSREGRGTRFEVLIPCEPQPSESQPGEPRPGAPQPGAPQPDEPTS